MAEAETHTKEELEAMSRLVLRRICKGRGMSSEECSKMEFDDMVAWIIEDQGGGGGKSKKAPPKSRAKAPPKGGKAPPKGGKKAPPKAPPKGGKAKSDESPPLIGDDILAKVVALDAKIDTIGEVMDQNLNAITEDMNELRSDVYKILERQAHLHNWLRADQVLTDDAAPDGMDFDDKDAEIDEACSGNEDGGDE
jgi:hypothetical protein